MTFQRKAPKRLYRRIARSVLSGRVSIENGVPVLRVQVRDTELRLVVRSMFEFVMASSIPVRERTTLDFIDGMSERDVFYDVGANVGVYSLYAAKRVRQVYGFEPHYESFGSFARNVILNRVSGKVVPLMLGCDKETGISMFNIIFADAAASGGQLNSRRRFGTEFEPELSYCVGTVRLDDCVKMGYEMPTWIKIDVDGVEERICDGCAELLLDTKVRGILVELVDDSEQIARVERMLERAGFELVDQEVVTKEAPICRNLVFKRG